MSFSTAAYQRIKKECDANDVTLIAVTKTKSIEEIMEAYEAGHRDFGENYVQELTEKHATLPKDIRWHFIGHLQTNKVKYIAPFVYLIHSVDSEKLLSEIEKQAVKLQKPLACLLQVYISSEETKFGLDKKELDQIISKKALYKNVQIKGLMGMASFTEDNTLITSEFNQLKVIYDILKVELPSDISVLSIGMSADYRMAISCGSTMVRIGSLLFGSRITKK